MTSTAPALSRLPHAAEAAYTVANLVVVRVPEARSPGRGRRRLSWRVLPLLDQHVLRCFVLAYLAFFVSLLALYVVVDFFTKTDEFTLNTQSGAELLRHVASYYLARLPWFFLRLNGVMALLAAVFALAWLERQNEVVAWLAAGVPARRLLAPVLAGVLAALALGVFNRELLVPRCGVALQRNADDPRGDKLAQVQGAYDDNMILIEGGAANPTKRTVEGARLTFPADFSGGLVHLHCTTMQHRPARGPDDNGWYLYGISGLPEGFSHPRLDCLDAGVCFLHTDVTFDRLNRPPSWFHYQPTMALVDLLNEHDVVQRRIELIMLLHRRLTTPVLDFLLVVVACLLLRVGQTGHSIYLKFGACLFLYAALQGIQFTCQGLSQHEIIDPMLAAWLPVLVLGPVTFACLPELRH